MFATVTILTLGITACDLHNPAAPSTVTSPTATSAGMTGQISGFAGTRSAFQFNVGTTPIQGDNSTVFLDGSQFSELRDGLMVDVTGAQQPGRFYASRLAIVSPAISLTGTITNKNGLPPEFDVTVGGRTVNVTALTDVKRKGDPQKSLALSTGQTVDVVGRVAGGGTVVASSINILSDAPGGGFWIEGTIGALSGSCPQLQLTVNGYAGAASLNTNFDGPCDALAIGDKVQIIGVVTNLNVMISYIKRL